MAQVSVRTALPVAPRRPAEAQKPRGLWRDAFQRLLRNRLAAAGFTVVMLFLAAAALGPYIAPRDFLAQDVHRALEGPSQDYWLGTDALGRDIFSRLLYGARTAAVIALTTTAISLTIGLMIGLTAGFAGGRIDTFLMWLIDVTMSLPNILLAMLINATLKYHVSSLFDSLYERTRNPFFLDTRWIDFVLIFGALALISWPGYARLIRSQVLSGRSSLYVEAARVNGATNRQILARHLLPNSLGPVVVAVTQGMGGAILLESSLSFLGIGVQPPNASWGSMLSESLTLWRSHPHLMLAPAITIGLIQIAFVFLGDGLNDALNPRQRRR
jgi:peptide/nickel transport system permease protein